MRLNLAKNDYLIFKFYLHNFLCFNPSLSSISPSYVRPPFKSPPTQFDLLVCHTPRLRERGGGGKILGGDTLGLGEGINVKQEGEKMQVCRKDGVG